MKIRKVKKAMKYPTKRVKRYIVAYLFQTLPKEKYNN